MTNPVLIKSKYQVLQTISEDILSYVYIGKNVATGELVYVWEYKRDFLNAKLIKKLVHFSEKLILIQHPHILQLKDFDLINGAFFTVCEYAKMSSLAVLVEQEIPLKKELVHIIIEQTLSAMMALESAQLVHGNINLSSIYITENGQIKLTDILLPLLILKPYITKCAVVDEGIFLASEFLIKKEYSIRSDIYSFGILLYFLSTQKWPYLYTPDIAQLKKSLLKNYPSPKELNPALTNLQEQIIIKCLNKDPLNRFPSFSDLKECLLGHKTIQQVESSSEESWIRKKIVTDMHMALYSKLKRLLTRLLIILPIIFIGLFAYLTYLNYLTSIPDIVVPNVVGLSQKEAVSVLEKQGLKSKIVEGFLRNDVPSGTVIESRPPSGRLVKKDRSIKLFISSSPASTEIPNLIGRTLEESQTMTEAGQLAIEVIGEEYSNTYPKGFIIEQLPSPSVVSTDNIPQQPISKISVKISKGFPLACTIKDTPSDPRVFQVNSTFSVLDTWEPQTIEIVRIRQKIQEKMYSAICNPSEVHTKDFTAERGDIIEIYYNTNLAYSSEVPPKKDVLDKKNK